MSFKPSQRCLRSVTGKMPVASSYEARHELALDPAAAPVATPAARRRRCSCHPPPCQCCRRFKLNLVCHAWREGLSDAPEVWAAITVDPRKKASTSRCVGG